MIALPLRNILRLTRQRRGLQARNGIQQMLQHNVQLLCAAVATLRFARQGFNQHRVDALINIGNSGHALALQALREGLLFLLLVHLAGAFIPEWRAVTVKEIVYHAAQRIDVRPLVISVPALEPEDFGRHEARRANAGGGALAISDLPRHAEVGQLECTRGGYHYVRGLYVPVNDATLVAKNQGIGNVPPHADYVILRGLGPVKIWKNRIEQLHLDKHNPADFALSARIDYQVILIVDYISVLLALHEEADFLLDFEQLIVEMLVDLRIIPFVSPLAGKLILIAGNAYDLQRGAELLAVPRIAAYPVDRTKGALAQSLIDTPAMFPSLKYRLNVMAVIIYHGK